MKKLLPMVIVSAFLVVLAGCGSSGVTLEDLEEDGVVTVGFANEAPYAYKNDEGELTGAAVEVARAVFKELGIEKMEGKLADWGELIAGVKTGKFDVITAGMAILPERCEEIDFAHPGIVYGEGMAVKEGNPHQLHSYEDIAADPKIKVAVLSGASEVGFLKESGVSEAQIKTYSDIPATLDAVKTGRAHVTTATGLTLKKALKSSGGDGLEFTKDFQQPDVEGVPSYGAAGFAPESDELRKAYNEELEKLRESGELAEVIKSVDLFDENNIIKKDVTVEGLCAG